MRFLVFKFVLAATSVKMNAPTFGVYAVAICVLLKAEIFPIFVFLIPLMVSLYKVHQQIAKNCPLDSQQMPNIGNLLQRRLVAVHRISLGRLLISIFDFCFFLHLHL